MDDPRQRDTLRGLRKGLTSYGDAGFSLFLRKAFIKASGYSDDALDRPIVGVTNTFSDFNPCHGNVPDLIESIKRGVMLAGGLPMVFPTISIGESFAHPTSMFLRNLMAMDTEEMIRAQPMDAVVVIGGCDKTLPAQVMAAASVDIPTVVVPTGPMVVGHHRGEVLGACTDCRRFWSQFRAGTIDEAEIERISGRLAPSVGTCMVMGTASTMACILEAMGLALPFSATAPAVHADRRRIAEASGKRAAEMAVSGAPRPSELITAASVRNAMVILQAIGGSTNGLIHLTAIAGRAGVNIDLEVFDRLGREVPVLLNLKPSGTHYMEHFHHAGGLPALLRELKMLLDLDAPSVSGGTIGDAIAAAEGRRHGRVAWQPGPQQCHHQAVRRFSKPDASHRARAGIRLRRRHDQAHRPAGAGCAGRGHSGFAQCRAERRAGHAGGRLSAHPHETGSAGCEGYGAHLRCPDERHRFRYHRVAYHARVGGWRPAGDRSDRRPD